MPGLEGPHEDLVGRIHRHIQRFASERGLPQAVVQIELRGGSRFTLGKILPEPGYGFITICPHAGEEDVPGELIVPVSAIERIELYAAEEEHPQFGFSLPDG